MADTNTFKCTNCDVYFIVRTENIESVEKAPCPECDTCALSVVDNPTTSSGSDNVEDRSSESEQECKIEGLEAEKTVGDLYYRVSRYNGR